MDQNNDRKDAVEMLAGFVQQCSGCGDPQIEDNLLPMHKLLCRKAFHRFCRKCRRYLDPKRGSIEVNYCHLCYRFGSPIWGSLGLACASSIGATGMDFLVPGGEGDIVLKPI